MKKVVPKAGGGRGKKRGDKREAQRRLDVPVETREGAGSVKSPIKAPSVSHRSGWPNGETRSPLSHRSSRPETPTTLGYEEGIGKEIVGCVSCCVC